MYYDILVFFKYLQSQYNWHYQSELNTVELNFFDHTKYKQLIISIRPRY